MTSYPRASRSFMQFRIAGCSMAVVTMCLPRLPRRFTVPKTAQLSASVPPEVKNTRSGSAPRAAATSLRAERRARAVSMPKPYRAEGLPQFSVSALVIASTASGQGWVVAELSR